MKMGRERTVLRWDIHASLIRDRIASVEASLASLREAPVPNAEQRAQLEAELTALRKRLAALGPSPRAKMG
jgi:hypothetical protein